MHAWHDVSVYVCIHAEKPATRRNKFNYATKKYFLAIIIIIINQSSCSPLALHRCVDAVGVSGGDGVGAYESRMISSNSNNIYALWRRVVVVIPAIRSNDHSVDSANSDENFEAVSEKPEEKMLQRSFSSRKPQDFYEETINWFPLGRCTAMATLNSQRRQKMIGFGRGENTFESRMRWRQRNKMDWNGKK